VRRRRHFDGGQKQYTQLPARQNWTLTLDGDSFSSPDQINLAAQS
jgi:hypothetical protein